MLVVYKYTFHADGAAYVGSCLDSYWPLRRHYRHISDKSCNRVLTARLCAGESHRLERLSVHDSIESCSAAETAAIKALPQALNKFEANGLVPLPNSIYNSELERLGLPVVINAPSAKPPYHSTPRQRNKPVRSFAVCSVCKERKEQADFPRDCTRFNGLHSKCSACHSYASKTGATAQQMRAIIAQHGKLPWLPTKRKTRRCRMKCMRCGCKLEGRVMKNRRHCKTCGQKEAQARFRAKQKRLHLCQDCNKPIEASREGKLHCQACIDKKKVDVKAAAAAKRKLGLCIMCGQQDAVRAGYCQPCGKKAAACKDSWRERQRAKPGMCKRCLCKKARPGTSQCATCRNRNRAYKEKLRAEGRCTCGREIEHHLEGSKCCERCRTQARERQRRKHGHAPRKS